MEVYKAIAEVAGELASRGIAKDGRNAAQGFNFRGIDDFPCYLFSDCGKVYSIRYSRFLADLVVPNGYRHVVLVEDKKKHRVAVHRIIAEAFHGVPAAGQVTNHKNGAKHDNRAENLEWVSPSENSKHAYDSGLRTIGKLHRARCAELGRSKRTTSKEKDCEVLSMFTGSRGDITRIAKIHNLSRDVVRRIIQGAKS